MKAADRNMWVDGVMSSLNGIQRAEAGDAMYPLIESRLHVPVFKGRIIPLQRVSIAAACILLLVVLNVLLLTKSNKRTDKRPDNMEMVTDYYGLTNDNGGFDL